MHQGLSGFTNVIAMYDAKLLTAESIIRTSDAEIKQLRRANESSDEAVARLEQMRAALQDEVAVLKGECMLLPCLQSEVAALQAEVEMLKKQAADIKEQATADAERAKSEIARLRASVDAKVCSASEQISLGMKAFYAQLVTKICAHLAGEGRG